MLGFELDIWGYLTFATLFVLLVAGLSAVVLVVGLPGRIAVTRHHPEAEAVNIMGWVGFLAQRLPVHPALARRRLAVLAFQHQDQRQHPTGGSRIRHPPRRVP